MSSKSPSTSNGITSFSNGRLHVQNNDRAIFVNGLKRYLKNKGGVENLKFSLESMTAEKLQSIFDTYILERDENIEKRLLQKLNKILTSNKNSNDGLKDYIVEGEVIDEIEELSIHEKINIGSNKVEKDLIDILSSGNIPGDEKKVLSYLNTIKTLIPESLNVNTIKLLNKKNIGQKDKDTLINMGEKLIEERGPALAAAVKKYIIKRVTTGLKKESIFSARTELRLLHSLQEIGGDYLTLNKNHGAARNTYQILHALKFFQTKLRKGEYIPLPSLAPIYEALYEDFTIGRPAYLVGETGGGKTACAKDFLKKVTGKSPITISCTIDTDESDLLSSKKFDIVKVQGEEGKNDSHFIQIKTDLEGLQKGAKLGLGVIIDEANKLPQDQLGTLNEYLSLAEKRGTTQVTQKNGGEEYIVHKSYFPILTGNEGEMYLGRTEFDASLKRRIDIIEFPYPTKKEVAYMFISLLGGKDRFVEIDGFEEKFHAFINGFDYLQDTYSYNKYESDGAIKELIYKVPSPDVGKLKEIANRVSGSEKIQGKSLESTLLDKYILQEKNNPDVQVYLFNVFKHFGLFKDFGGTIYTGNEDNPVDTQKIISQDKDKMEARHQIEAYAIEKRQKEKNNRKDITYNKVKILLPYHEEIGGNSKGSKKTKSDPLNPAAFNQTA